MVLWAHTDYLFLFVTCDRNWLQYSPLTDVVENNKDVLPHK